VINKYAKGANFERKIVSDLWGHGWASMRAAGSGTVGFPVPDVIGAKDGRIILIECKATRKDRLSLKHDILDLEKFSYISGGEAYIAIKFYKKDPRFYEISKIIAKGNYSITIGDPFISFEALLMEQKRL